jgi:hypothetical protein
LGCTAAAGTVGGAKRQRDTHPSNSPALGAGEEAIVRAIASAPLPAANGTTMVIGRVG